MFVSLIPLISERRSHGPVPTLAKSGHHLVELQISRNRVPCSSFCGGQDTMPRRPHETLSNIGHHRNCRGVNYRRFRRVAAAVHCVRWRARILFSVRSRSRSLPMNRPVSSMVRASIRRFFSQQSFRASRWMRSSTAVASRSTIVPHACSTLASSNCWDILPPLKFPRAAQLEDEQRRDELACCDDARAAFGESFQLGGSLTRGELQES